MQRSQVVGVLFGLLLLAGTAFAGSPITIDDSSPLSRREGVWADNTANNFASGGCLGGKFYYTSKYPPFAKTGREKFFWSPKLPKAGLYKVEVSFRASVNRSSRVTYLVTSQGGNKKVVVDQTQSTGEPTWSTLGEFPFEAGTGAEVALISDGGGSAAADAARFTFVNADGSTTPSGDTHTPGGPGTTGGLDDILNPPGDGTIKTVRLDKAHRGLAQFLFTAPGKARVSACLATYRPAFLSVRIRRADGTEKEWLSWSRQNDLDPSACLVDGKEDPASMVELKPGDFSAQPVDYELEGKPGDTITLTLEGEFGAGEPFVSITGPGQ